MNDQKINLDIRTILAQLNIDFERYADWNEENHKTELWNKREWMDKPEDSEEQAAATRT